MKTQITTIEQVLDQAETLNKVLELTNQSTEVYIQTIKSVEDLEKLAKQERGNFFDFEGYYACSVTLGNIRYLLTTKNA